LGQQQALLPTQIDFLNPQQPMLQASKLLKLGEQALLSSQKLFLHEQQRLLGHFWRLKVPGNSRFGFKTRFLWDI